MSTDRSTALRVLQQFYGYTERQAAFLYLVALHSGYFLGRQYDAFIGARRGGSRRRFINRLLANRHARLLRCTDGTSLFHLHGKSLYVAIGVPNSRNRRSHEAYVVRPKLMALDLLLGHPE